MLSAISIQNISIEVAVRQSYKIKNIKTIFYTNKFSVRNSIAIFDINVQIFNVNINKLSRNHTDFPIVKNIAKSVQ